MARTGVMLLLTYTPREDTDLQAYHRWLREVDNPFFNSRAAVKHYANWRVVEPKVGAPSFTHFDLLYVEDLKGFEAVFGDEAVEKFAKEWVRKWGKVPDPELPDQSVNYHAYLCERIAGPDEG
jgi:hypothetical protein